MTSDERFPGFKATRSISKGIEISAGRTGDAHRKSDSEACNAAIGRCSGDSRKQEFGFHDSWTRNWSFGDHHFGASSVHRQKTGDNCGKTLLAIGIAN